MRNLSVELACDANARLGEGPAWSARDACLFWVDIDRGAVHEFDPSTGRDAEHLVRGPVGAAVPRATGGLVLARAPGYVAYEPATGEQTVLASVDLPAGARMNDGKCDAQGRFFAGTLTSDNRPRASALFRLDADRSVTTVIGGVTLSNGLGWDPAGTALYYVDSPTQRVDRFRFDPDSGCVSGRQQFASFPPGQGVPDGLTVDDEGCVWIALWGGGVVHRYTSAGALDSVVDVPVPYVTSCTFGGAGRDELYITTAGGTGGCAETGTHAGGLFVCNPGSTGPSASPCAV